jgi:hypothetical protein
MLEFALPTMKRAFEGAPLRKGDHFHLVPEASPIHGTFPRMAGELMDLAGPGDREKVKAALEKAGLAGPLKLVRDRSKPGGN